MKILRTLFSGLALVLAACGAPPSTDQRPVLRVGDQLHGLRTLLEAAGEAEPTDYKIEWSNFLGGPAIIAAQTGGSLDLGQMQETPLVFAQAAGSPVRVVAVGQRAIPGTSSLALVVAPDSPIQTVADLRGRAIGFMPGTVTQYFLVRALESAGLTLADIRPVQISSPSPSLLRNGDVDATITADPNRAQLESEGAIRVVVPGGAPLTADFTYLVAPQTALDDPARSALIADFVERVARASRWQREHVAEATPHFARTFNVTPAIAEIVIRRAPTRYAPIDSTVIARHQEEADIFLRLGLIRTQVDAAQLFDNRYDARVAAVEPAS